MTAKKITLRELRERYGGSERFWERRRQSLVKAGLLNRIGNSYFGTWATIDEAVASAGPEVWKA